MCDTIVIVRDPEDGQPGSSGRNDTSRPGVKQVLFAKNSDRDPNEAQMLDWQPGRTHPSGATLRCTHIDIPQVETTSAVLLSRPFWMWGAEMGANEHGVVIGNEAVFTREPMSDTGLTGMDLLRLALERSRTAEEAVEVITSLIATHGQGGGHGYERPNFKYHNSYIVADPTGALVLETAGEKWAVEVVDGERSISNGLTIEGFADEHSDHLRTKVSACRVRQPRTQSLAAEAQNPHDLASILRDHGGERWPSYRRHNGTLSIACMHGGSEVASSVTTGSWISSLGSGPPRHWVTATSSPCLSLFKPVSVEEPLSLDPSPEGTIDDSLWWTHEHLHRRVMANPAGLASSIIEERDAVEREWFARPPSSAEAFATHQRLLAEWLDSVPDPRRDRRPRFARKYWAKRDRLSQPGTAATKGEGKGAWTSQGNGPNARQSGPE